MKIQMMTVVLGFFSATAFAHPGSNTLTCKSAAKSGSKQALRFELTRSNAPGTFAPSYSLTVNGKKYAFTTDDEMKQLGETYHDSPLGVILVTADNSGGKNDDKHLGQFSVVAVPATVKTIDIDGKPLKWTFKGEKDSCTDSNGKATFKGIFHGYLRDPSAKDGELPLDTQIMDCELKYDSGMAC